MKRTLPPTYLIVALVGMTALHFLWPIHHYLRFPVNLTGLVPLALGISLNIMADRQFTRHQTTVKPFERSTALVTSFPFSVSRNPMYLGLTMMLLGVALLLGTVSPLLPVVGFALLMDRFFVGVEERMLADSFGDEWERYRAQVRRWL